MLPDMEKGKRTFVRRVMFLWVYILPLPACLGLVFAWHRLTGSWPFVLHAMLLPVLYGYIVPGIGTNLLHRWHFTGPFRLGHYYIHHGFMYAGNMGLLLLIPFLGQTADSFSLTRAVSIVLCAAMLHGFLLWLHDIGIVHCGMVEIYNRPAKEGRSPAEIVTYYAPLCFSLIGAAYAISAAIAYEGLVVRQATGTLTQAWMLAVGVALTFTVPSLAYRWLE